MGANDDPQDLWWEPWWPDGLWPEVTLTPADIKELAAELGRVRQRGIRRVDIQAPKVTPTPILDSLAELYASLKGFEDTDRPARFRELLWDGLQKYAQKKGRADIATWICDLFFWPDDPNRSVSPGDLLDAVRKRLGYAGRDSSFARLRREEFEEFAAYLVALVGTEAEQANEQIKADRIKEEAERRHIEAEARKKAAENLRERIKEAAEKTQLQSKENKGQRATTAEALKESRKGTKKKRPKPTQEQRKRQLAREKFLRQQERRTKARAKERLRNAIVASVLGIVFAVSVALYTSGALKH